VSEAFLISLGDGVIALSLSGLEIGWANESIMEGQKY